MNYKCRSCTYVYEIIWLRVYNPIYIYVHIGCTKELQFNFNFNLHNLLKGEDSSVNEFFLMFSLFVNYFISLCIGLTVLMYVLCLQGAPRQVPKHAPTCLPNEVNANTPRSPRILLLLSIMFLLSNKHRQGLASWSTIELFGPVQYYL